MNTTNVHGYPIIGFLQTEVQSGKVCGYIIVEKEKEYVVSWYRDGDAEWSSGDYIQKIPGSSEPAYQAVREMALRAARYM